MGAEVFQLIHFLVLLDTAYKMALNSQAKVILSNYWALKNNLHHQPKSFSPYKFLNREGIV